jgi:predicted GNAT family acetyltransferase
MEVTFHENIERFYDLAFKFLLEHEPSNALLFSILNTIKINPFRYGKEKALLMDVSKRGEIKFIALQTPPHNLVLSYSEEPNALKYLIESMLDRHIELPGVLGPAQLTKTFVELWYHEKRLEPRLVMNERLYKLNNVEEKYLGNHEFIESDEIFTSLIQKWAREFMLEALPESEHENSADFNKKIETMVVEGEFYLLLDQGIPVTMARKAGKTPNGNMINFVYTPPDIRRRGHATECVAKLSKMLLEKGNAYCFLFTDLMNPTSNSIYQKIGFKAVIDVDQYEFVKT